MLQRRDRHFNRETGEYDVAAITEDSYRDAKRELDNKVKAVTSVDTCTGKLKFPVHGIVKYLTAAVL